MIVPLHPKKILRKVRQLAPGFEMPAGELSSKAVLRHIATGSHSLRRHEPIKPAEVLEASAFGRFSLLKTPEGIFLEKPPAISHPKGEFLIVKQFRHWPKEQILGVHGEHLIAVDPAQMFMGKEVFLTDKGSFVEWEPGVMIAMKDIGPMLPLHVPKELRQEL